jgi:hypothetical protein
LQFNAYHGLAGMYIVRDCCGDTQLEENLPSGDFESPLLIGDRMLASDGTNDLYEHKNKNNKIKITFTCMNDPPPFFLKGSSLCLVAAG